MTDADPPMGESRAPSSPVVALLTVSAVWETRLDAALRDHGLSTRRYGLLAHICSTPGISFSELARRSQITVQSAHSAVRMLVDAELVRDATAHAGAASDLRVTAAGEVVLADAEVHLARLDAELRESLPQLSIALDGLHDEPLTGNLQAD